MTKIKHIIAQRAAENIKSIGNYLTINLGIGIPTLISNYLNEVEYYIHTENGLLGVTAVASYFNSAESFAMIRSGHIDIAVLGCLQVDSFGMVANWAIPGKDIIGVGGAMDLLEGANTVIITTTHLSKNGIPKLVERCTFPISSRRKADIIVTDMAVFKWENHGYELVELVGETDLEIVKKTP